MSILVQFVRRCSAVYSTSKHTSPLLMTNFWRYWQLNITNILSKLEEVYIVSIQTQPFSLLMINFSCLYSNVWDPYPHSYSLDPIPFWHWDQLHLLLGFWVTSTCIEILSQKPFITRRKNLVFERLILLLKARVR